MRPIHPKVLFIYPSIAFISLFCLNTAAAQQIDSSRYVQIRELQETVKNEFAPDKRLKLVELSTTDVPGNIYVIQTTESAAQKKLQAQTKGIDADITIILLPDASVENKHHGVVNLSVANLRTRPDHAAEMASQVLLGAQVDILQKVRGDYRVRTPEGYIAWVPTSSIVAMDETELQQWSNSKKVIFTSEYGKSYAHPTSTAAQVSDLVYGDILTLVGENDKYYTVSYPDKRKAYVKKDDALPFNKWLSSRTPTADNVIASAKTMLGLPYLWGGTSTKGVDCSGFTKTAYFMNGFVIPRDASQQVLAGASIDILGEDGHFDPKKALQNLKPADLLFFAAGKNSNPNARVTHVALYIGNGTFIHAAGSVRINSMLKDSPDYDDFQTRTVVAAKRYLGIQDPTIQKVENSNYYK
ncbi:C40 family peptidase [Sphingobacterium sp. SYP-B4668]|uniref:C40 family peptidase n=1 Tax=Sphingobacterium sp. SYP-B4668 TaxID=2996035 RepID=UPI0022DE2858|nr:C40 family peptidase [Sphingobacterium sp. SYP-B4668]